MSNKTDDLIKVINSASACGGDTTAQDIFNNLKGDLKQYVPNVDLDGDDFKLPDNSNTDLHQNIKSLTIEDLTTRVVDGTGAFDAIMAAVSAHLEREYRRERITGASYAETYLGAMQAALQNAVQFLLGKDQAYWQAIQIQMAARKAEIEVVIARVQLAIAKVQFAMALAQMRTEEANYVLTKMKIATEDANYCNTRAQLKVINEQYNNLVIQGEVLNESVETARAQTLETRRDGTPIIGIAGSQIMLSKAQKTAYERDTEYKFAKMMIDYWLSQKAIDEGLDPPSQLNNSMIGNVVMNTKNKIPGL